MTFPGYMARDQHGETARGLKHPRKDLMHLCGAAMVGLVLAPSSLGCRDRRERAARGAAATSAPAAPNGNLEAVGKLSFPGWEDVVVGARAPADARQACRRPFGNEGLLEECTGCRDSALLFPCISVFRGGDGVTAQVLAKLSPNDAFADTQIQFLQRRWRPVTWSQGHGDVVSSDYWCGEANEHAFLVTNYLDLGHANFDDPNYRASLRSHPIRLVTISRERCPSPDTAPREREDGHQEGRMRR